MSLPCPDCFSGTVSDATPTGSTETIHGLPTYVAHPEDNIKPKGVVVIITDAFGWEFVNNRALADIYAQKGGFLVYLPDFFAGNAMTTAALPLPDKIMTPASWLITLFYKPIWLLQAIIAAVPFFWRNRTAVMKPRVLAFFHALRAAPPPIPTAAALRIGVAGFCFGGRYAILLAHDVPSSRAPRYTAAGTGTGALAPLVDAAFVAHPSLVTVPGDIEAVTRPLSVTVGHEDMAMSASQVQQMRTLLEKKGDDHECVILPGAKHGFAIRVDPADEVQMEFAASAERQAIAWFTKWFA